MVAERPTSMPEVRVLPAADAALAAAFAELQAVAARGDRPLVGLATGATYAPMFARMQAGWQQGTWPAEAYRFTHLDEYQGFAPDRRGGMVNELETACPVLRQRRLAGMFLPVPHDGSAAALAAHEAALQRAGGVQLQFLGIGRNGHLAFNEPGTPFDSAFHVTALAATTREDARRRFAPEEPPTHACTAGLATILAARRIVLCAFGRAKAPAVRAMLAGDVTPACPASVLRRHGDALVLLDREAAGELPAALRSAVGGS